MEQRYGTTTGHALVAWCQARVGAEGGRSGLEGGVRDVRDVRM